jgi:hypothetical protein
MMLCSRCSEPVPPVVAIDIDGTLAPYHPHFIEFASSWLGYQPKRVEYEGGERFRDWMCQTFGIDLSTFRSIKLAYRQGGLKRTMGTYPGASSLTRRLREAGGEVWLTTTRPHNRYDRIDPDSVEWARRNNIEFDALLFGENKLGELARRIDPRRVVAVLDDLPWILDQARIEHLGQPILRRTEWNMAVSWTGWEFASLDGVATAITDLMRSYDEGNGVGSEQDRGEHRDSDPGRVVPQRVDRGWLRLPGL